MLSIQDLHDRAGNLDLSHWNAAETFSLLEAALLSVGVDPLEYTDLERLRKCNHPNWKNGMLLLRSLKEGVCIGEIVCIDIFIKDYYGDGHYDWNAEKKDVLELSVGQANDIIEGMTKFSRKSLFDWYKRKGLLRTATPPTSRPVITQSSPSSQLLPAPTLALVAPSYLDPTNPLSPKELRASVEAWQAATALGDPRDRGKAATTALREYLEQNKERLDLSKEAINRIATVANWNKTGGATKIPG